LNTNTSRTTPVWVAAPILIIAALVFTHLGPGTTSEADHPIAIPSITNNDDGYVLFNIGWEPPGYPEAVTFSDLTVNGQRYLVSSRPANADPGQFKQASWESPRIPNHLPPEQVTASLHIRIDRPHSFAGRLWTGCTIKINGRPAPGYMMHGYGKGIDRRFNRLDYTCETKQPKTG
jgi:hypothetical protein